MTARLAILISGRGSNMRAIAEACADDRLDAEVVLVIADRADAAGIDGARSLDIPTRVVARSDHDTRADFDRAVGQALHDSQPDRVLLAGFMQILGKELVEAWQGRMLNIHPSLLPKYPGLDTHRRAIEAGDTEHGASVHLVTPELDAGPVIAQVRVPIKRDDTPTVLANRVLQEEHTLYIRALQQSLDDSRADLKPNPSQSPCPIS